MGSSDSGSLITLSSGRKVYAEKHDRVAVDGAPPLDVAPLLFIHGFYQSTRTWTPLLPYFPHYTRIAFDVEPHGNTGDIGGSLSTSQHARDAKEVLEYFGYEKAIIFGHSAGSIIVYQFAHDYPQMTVKIILMGPLMLPHLEIISRAADIFRGFTFDQVLDLHYSYLAPSKRNNPDMLAIVKSETERNEPQRERLAQYFAQVALYEYTDVKGVETWIIKGRDDGAIPAGACEAIRDLTKGRIVEVPTGHFFTFEDVEVTADAIKSILEKEPAARRS